MGLLECGNGGCNIRISRTASGNAGSKIGDGGANGGDVCLHNGDGVGKSAHGSFLSMKVVKDCGEVIAN